MLVKKFLLSDLRELEFQMENMTVLDIFNNFSVEGLIYLVSIGNGNISFSQAADILQEYVDSTKSLISAFNEVKDYIFPVDTGNEEVKDYKIKYDAFTEILNEYSMQLASAGISLTEFWEMDTYTLYYITKHINKKIIMETNRQLQLAHAQAALTGSAFGGKLPKEAPKINMNESEFDKNQTVEYNGKLMSMETFMNLQKMQRLSVRSNKHSREEV